MTKEMLDAILSFGVFFVMMVFISFIIHKASKTSPRKTLSERILDNHYSQHPMFYKEETFYKPDNKKDGTNPKPTTTKPKVKPVGHGLKKKGKKK